MDGRDASAEEGNRARLAAAGGRSGKAPKAGRGETKTSSFGVGRREGHDATAFYERFTPPELSNDSVVNRPGELVDELGLGRVYHGAIDELRNLPESSVALVVTSPPYFVGKDYELAVTGSDGDRIPATYLDFLEMLRSVFAECRRVLEPGGRIAVNVANLGRKPYRSLSADVISILQDDLGLLLRGEVIWEKSSASSGSCAWGSFGRASNPVLRDVTERVVVASKGQFSRALPVKARREQGLPHESTITNDEFVDVTKDVWRIDAESATRIGHPAPFPIELPRRLIDLYTYVGDLVVDPFVGSGTALVAAARAGRIGVGYDTDPTYVDLSEHRLAEELARIDEAGDPGPAPSLEALSFDDKLEHVLRLAVDEGRKVQDIARRHLTDAGFTGAKEKPRDPSGIVDVAFTAADGSGRDWWVDVAGSFTTTRPGLQRTDAVWRLLGRLSVLRSADAARGAGDGEACRPILVLTSSAPKPGSPGDKALRAVGPELLFDVIELYDPAGLERLRHYATADGSLTPEPGFWTPADLEPPPAG